VRRAKSFRIGKRENREERTGKSEMRNHIEKREGKAEIEKCGED
jgi:hypothetical protein